MFRVAIKFKPDSDALAIMTYGFLFFGPLVMGMLVIWRAGADRRLPIWQWVALPWLSTVIFCLGAMLFALEGFICVVLAMPIGLLGSLIGGIIGGALNRSRYKLSRNATACVALLPVLIAFTEPHLNVPTQTRTVASEIRIHASPQTVWQNIERVPAISPDELEPTWTHRIGFPRPVEATLSFEGVGGVRHASFEHGLLFIETITAWEPQHRLSFGIRADTAHIPPTTLDEHVTIGGRYFDVLDGEYVIEPVSNSDVILHLTSHQRLSTDVNGYAGFWTDAVMQNLQTSILKVIQHRCEHE